MWRFLDAIVNQVPSAELGTSPRDSVVGPLVSVLCLTYRHRRFIEQCIDSLISQETRFQYEVIVRDDGSDDGTREFLEQLQRKGVPNLVLILEPENTWSRIGPITPLLSAARGEIIAFCEGDDFWTSPQKLERCVGELLGDNRLVLCGHRTGAVADTGERLVAGDGSLFVAGEEGRWDVGSTPKCHTSGMVLRKSVLMPWLPLLAQINTADELIRLIVAESGESLILPEVWSMWREHPDGYSALDPRTRQHSLLELFHLWIPNARLTLSGSSEAVGYYTRNLMKLDFAEGEWVRALKRWLRSVRCLVMTKRPAGWRGLLWLLSPPYARSLRRLFSRAIPRVRSSHRGFRGSIDP